MLPFLEAMSAKDGGGVMEVSMFNPGSVILAITFIKYAIIYEEM